MKKLTLNPHQTEQLAVLATYFHLNGELKKEHYSPEGPAHDLMEMLSQFTGDFTGQLILLKDPYAIDIYTATLIEMNEDGETYSTILHADTPVDLMNNIIKQLETECDERGFVYYFNAESLMNDLRHDNEQRGPFHIRIKNSDTEFLVSSKKLSVKIE